jgi:hypothetical protein
MIAWLYDRPDFCQGARHISPENNMAGIFFEACRVFISMQIMHALSKQRMCQIVVELIVFIIVELVIIIIQHARRRRTA